MEFFYDCCILLLRGTYRLASLFHAKAKLFCQGRDAQWKQLQQTFSNRGTEPLLWIHCASLGEFEQGRPVLEAIRRQAPHVRILLTFFSPSGYEVRKDYDQADYIFYLPWDTRNHARFFAEKIRPTLAVFVKYEFWHHYTLALHRAGIPLVSISAIFRKEQLFFQPYGSFFVEILTRFQHIFVQNEASVELLSGLNIHSVTKAGDTRFDRVAMIAKEAAEVPEAARFSAALPVMVIGSAWPEDMEVLYPLINATRGKVRFIIAPHEIGEAFLNSITQRISGKTIRYSTVAEGALDPDVLLVDRIGLLSRLYRYGKFAFVGGGYRQGLHNILEAACYGVPVFFGNKAYQKFDEAVQLIRLGGAKALPDADAVQQAFHAWMDNPQAYSQASNAARQYVADHVGATDKITSHCLNQLRA